MKEYTLIIFDTDGTLTTTITGEMFRSRADDWQWLPGRIGKLHELKRQGIHRAIATNQGGVAFGYLQQPDILLELSKMIAQAGIPAGGLYICYSHPKASIERFRMEDVRRKPGPGMLLEAMRDFEASPGETLMVGDRPEDEQAANAAGCDFMWADQFFA